MNDRSTTRSALLGCSLAAAACVFGACALVTLGGWVAWTAVSNIRIELPDGEEFANTLLAESFKAMDRDQKLACIRGLPHDPQALPHVPFLIAALDDPDAEVRAAGAAALWRIDPVAAEQAGAP